ncbi:ssDNA binding protein-like protein Ssb3 [Paraphoma chrysanthemicola]|uniref:SsDNA binding protein-like protein Ssb3 n=1 Tax=Paraphoma chrysanthemicola TaxID=798071 RepID=A0A8K0W390_9PLEO|nr:ssDNA binding protein-like protein Ssb3 [Paraphoma chrysanthemicola]KAH7092240.1 ssDNA binding protein-like protein Ssb3 [Paraphoma chrysanthemicola]
MDHPQTPRILAPHLQTFQHRIVRVLGKVVQLRGETAIIDAGGHIDVILTRDSHLAVGHAVEIIGKVDQNLHIKVQAATDFGTSIDFNAANAVVEATHRYKEIFYDGE